MSFITINEKWRIRKDPLNYIPEYYVAPYKKDDGTMTKERWTGVGYYSSVPLAISGIIRHEGDKWVEASDGIPLKAYANMIHDLQREYLQAMKEVIANG